MRFWDVITMANHNLWRSKLRTTLTILAIFIGAFTLTLTNSLGAGVQAYLNRQLGDVSAPGIFYVTPKTNDNPFANSGTPKEYNPQKTAASAELPSMTADDLTKLKAIDGVAWARPYVMVSTDYVSAVGQKKYVLSSVRSYNSLQLELAAGRLLNAQNDQGKAMIPENYLPVLGFHTAGEALGKSIQLGYRTRMGKTAEHAVTVVGVSKSSLLTAGDFYVDDSDLQAMYSAQSSGQLSDHFSAALVSFTDANPDHEAAEKTKLQKAGSYQATSLKEQITTVTNTVSAITVGLSVVGAIALLAASFGIINTLLMSVYERTQEVGLMKALGMRRSTVFSLFAVEAVLVGFWGSVVAILAGFGASRIINAWATKTFLSSFNDFQLLVVTPFNVGLVMLLIMAIAFLAGTLPAIKASRLNPIEALRTE